MSGGIDATEVAQDLLFYNDIAELYSYDNNDIGEIWVQHYDDEGQIIGTQAVTITVGEFKAANE